MEYVAGSVHRVIVKADNIFVRNNAILHSCDNLTILFFIHIIMSKKYKSCQQLIFCCSIPKDCTEGEGGEALAPSLPPLFLKNINRLNKK